MSSGYTLLFATLIASLVLGVAAFITGVARKQYILSSTARDSMFSFYAADSGIECLTKDQDSGDLATTTPFAVSCAGQNLNFSFTPINSQAYPSGSYNVFEASTTVGFSSSTPYVAGAVWGCSLLSIDQVFDGANPDVLLHTIIVSRGYNLCDYNRTTGVYTPTASSRTVERALQWSI